MTEEGHSSKRSFYNKNELMKMVREDLVEKFLKLQNYLDYQSKKIDELMEVKESASKIRQQMQEATQREGILVMRLTIKEQDVQELMNQIQEIKQASNPGSTQLQSLYLDPAVNHLFHQMKKELQEYKIKLQTTQDDISGIKFTPESQVGKRLILKCRQLQQENEEIGHMISSGSISKLEAEVAQQKMLVQQFRSAEFEVDNYLDDIEVEMQGMQATIYTLQQQLIKYKEHNKRDSDKNRYKRASRSRDSNHRTTSADRKKDIQRSSDYHHDEDRRNHSSDLRRTQRSRHSSKDNRTKDGKKEDRKDNKRRNDKRRGSSSDSNRNDSKKVKSSNN